MPDSLQSQEIVDGPAGSSSSAGHIYQSADISEVTVPSSREAPTEPRVAKRSGRRVIATLMPVRVPVRPRPVGRAVTDPRGQAGVEVAGRNVSGASLLTQSAWHGDAREVLRGTDPLINLGVDSLEQR
jgi:hypothetical protein